MPLIKFVNHVDAGGHEIRNRKVEIVTSLPTPSSAQEGREVYNSSDNRFYVCTGTSWELQATDSEKLNGETAAYYLARGNHTGTITSAVVSDFDAQVNSHRLDEFAKPTAAVDFNTQNVTGVKAATAADHAVNKAQLDELSNRVDAGAAGVAIKKAVRVVATGNVTLNGPQTVDGVLLAADDRVLLAGQTDATKNGIYVVKSAAWVRAEDADENGELAPGTLVAIREGNSEADSLWGLTTDSEIVIGTTDQNWARVIAGSTGGFTVAGAGLQGSSGTVSVKAGTGIIADGTGTKIDTTLVARKYVGAVPAGNTTATVTHNLGTQDVIVTVKDAVTNDVVLCGVSASASNAVTLDFSVAPTSNQYKVIVVG